MSVKYSLIALLKLIFFSTSGWSQTLNMGDTLPVKVFNEVWNHENSSISLDDYQGKFVVFDFWGIYCASCLSSFPFIQEIQEEFDDDIQFIAVNKTLDVDSVERFFKQRKHLKPANIPHITNDTLLNQYFPHQGMPYYVILDRNGKVVQKADRIIKSSATFKKMLQNDFSNFSEEAKRMYLPSLFDKRWDHLPIFASYILKTPSSEGLRLTGGSNTNGKGILEFGTIEFLYKRAYESLYSEIDVFKPNRVQLEVKNENLYREPKGLDALQSQKWTDDNMFTYVNRFPSDYTGDPLRIMREDLLRYFGLHVYVEKRKIPHLVLENVSKKNVLRSKGGEPKNTFTITNIKSVEKPYWRELKNQPFNVFSDYIESLTEYGLKQPFSDQTGINYSIDFKMKGKDLDELDLGKIRAALKEHGLDLVTKEIEIDVMVLKEL